MKRKVLIGIALVLVTMLPFSVMAFFYKPVHAAKVYTVWNTPEPKEIRIAIRENNWSGQPDPRGRVLYVKTVPYREYVRDILPNEWLPSWHRDSLTSGAMAIKMFAWYHHLFPVTIEGYKFDVDNTVNFQVYRERTSQPETDVAFDAVEGKAYGERGTGEITELNYRAGIPNNPNYQYRNAQKMAQWGSEYWATKGKNWTEILQFYYINRDLFNLPGGR